MSGALRLRAEEAVPLLHTLVARAAADLGLRVLAIKGPVVALQGMRAPRASADLDVLVHPRDLGPLVDGLVALGWRRAVEGTYASIMPPHSTNLLSDLWPVAMDVHHYFPGFLADAGEVFARGLPVNAIGVTNGMGRRPGGRAARKDTPAPTQTAPRCRTCRTVPAKPSQRTRCARWCSWPMTRMRLPPCDRSS